MNTNKMITVNLKIKAKVITTMHTYQRMKDHILIIMAMIMI